MVDANAFVYISSLELWSQVRGLLTECGLEVLTIESVRRRELTDDVRHRLDEWSSDGLVTVCEDPDKQTLGRKARKLRRKVSKRGRNNSTSNVDLQLLFLAAERRIPLLTCENDLTTMTAGFKYVESMDLLDVVDVLNFLGLIDDQDRKRALMNWPQHRGPDTLDLVMVTDHRGGIDRFDCA